MRMFPHVVTLYNATTTTDLTTMQDKTARNITVLRGVLLESNKATHVRKDGETGDDTVTLYVPFGVQATGPDGSEKTYCSAREYQSRDDTSGAYTFAPGANTQDDKTFYSYFAKGEVMEPDKTFEALSRERDGVYAVTSVREMDYGGLQHWEIGGA